MRTDAAVLLRRNGVVESVHAVSAALVDASGRLRSWAGDPGLVAFIRSSAKPFQAIPLVADGVTDAFEMSERELAICCASHGGERAHLRVVAGLLRRIGARAHDLACGPHPPMYGPAARALARSGRRPGRLHNNCSGKHAGMIAWARHTGAPVEGYPRADHAMQVRVREELAAWTEMRPAELALAVDGCGIPTFAMPLDRMALAFARFARAAATEPQSPAGRVASAMMAEPFYVAGTGRLCSEWMQASAGARVAKIGAEGVFGLALLPEGEGLAVKVEDGSRRAVSPAVLEFLRQAGRISDEILEKLESHHRVPVRNTRGETVGELCAEIRVRSA